MARHSANWLKIGKPLVVAAVGTRMDPDTLSKPKEAMILSSQVQF